MKKQQLLKRALLRAREASTNVNLEISGLKKRIGDQRNEINALLSGTHGFEDLIEEKRKLLYQDLNRYRHLKAKRKVMADECKTLKQLVNDEA